MAVVVKLNRMRNVEGVLARTLRRFCEEMKYKSSKAGFFIQGRKAGRRRLARLANEVDEREFTRQLAIGENL